MTCKVKHYIIILILSVTFNYGRSQTIEAGNDTTICLGGTASLSSTVTSGSFGTDSYTFEIIPYAPEPYTGGTGVTFSTNQDDEIAGPFDIGFPFCFFNVIYTQFYIGSNGWVGFTYNSNWTTYFSATLPNTNNSCPKNCIMAPWEDWYVGLPGTPNPGVYYYVTGTAPNRKLVVYWPDTYQYWCRAAGAEKAQFQIVLNEQSSIIENHLTRKPLCSSGNPQATTATQGVHNATGTVAFTATGRNSTQWSAYDESTRFVPSGTKWYTGGFPGGTIVGYGSRLNISPAVTTVYTAVMETCGGTYATDDVTVTVKDAEFTYSSYSWCKDSQNPVPTILQPGGVFTSTPPGLIISPSSGIIDVAASSTGTYDITYTISTPCTVTKTRSLSIWPLPVPAISGSANVCPDPQSYTYTTQPGMTNYTWQVIPDGTVLAGGTPVNDFVTTAWNIPGNKAILVNYKDIHGCTAASPVSYNVTVHPFDVPVISGTSTPCQDQTIIYNTQPGMTSYIWTVSAGGTVVSGGSSSDPFVSVKWNSSGNEKITVDFTNSAGCRVATPTELNILVNPTPVSVAENQTICSGTQTNLTLQSNQPGTTFSWICTPLAGGISGYLNSSGPSITQILYNSQFLPGKMFYTITPILGQCPGIPVMDTVTVKPSPVVSFSICNDTITTADAKPIILKGGIPPAGTYSGPGVAAGVFNPALAGTGNHVITYSYNNTWNCSVSQTHRIRVIPAPFFICGGNYADPRDGKSYPTVQIGTQCWLAANLNFGTPIDFRSNQRDNCTYEKYCYGNLSSRCSSSGGLYEWNEIMDYSEVPGGKGICPPTWHIPTEAEWILLFSNYINNGFAASALKYTGFSGFNALLDGAEHSNVQFDYDTFATFHWTSTPAGSYKAWAHGMNSYDPSVSFYPSRRNNAFSVRCIKD